MIVTGAGGAAAGVDPSAPGGLVYSIVDSLTTTPDTVTLNPNDELIGADTSVSAGLNLGTSASSAGQGTPRELGARFANRITPVNVVYLWVDRSVASVATLFSFSVWRSDDGTNWTAVAHPPAGRRRALEPGPGAVLLPARPAAGAVQAQYLKVVVRPLPAAAAADPQLATIWVTKLQFFHAQAADQVRGRSFTLGGSLDASARYRILDSPVLTFDNSLQVGHSNGRDALTWSLLNGLSAQQRLSKVLATSGRVERLTVSDAGRGRELVGRWSATLTAEPLPTLGGGATYAGLWSRGRPRPGPEPVGDRLWPRRPLRGDRPEPDQHRQHGDQRAGPSCSEGSPRPAACRWCPTGASRSPPAPPGPRAPSAAAACRQAR